MLFLHGLCFFIGFVLVVRYCPNCFYPHICHRNCYFQNCLHQCLVSLCWFFFLVTDLLSFSWTELKAFFFVVKSMIQYVVKQHYDYHLQSHLHLSRLIQNKHSQHRIYLQQHLYPVWKKAPISLYSHLFIF